MVITNRELAPGTRLTATYKKEQHVLEVVQTDEGIRYRSEALKQDFKSPSAAGSAVMGGIACNGWRFWSVEGEEPVQRAAAADKPAKTPKRTAKPKAATKGRKPSRNGNGTITTYSDQAGVPEGMARFWCNACMDTFEAAEFPKVCPNGHSDDIYDGETPAAVEAEADA